ncbi:SAM-dependent methyltransferase [Thiobacillus denitrificans]|nr:class I SAM-dependent methyltransferase [Thiobacillus denitrificans]
MSMRLLARKMLFMRGASWQHPVIRLGLTALDPVDAIIRSATGLRSLPRYSTRVRSNGLSNQFGGGKFARQGRVILHMLQRHCALSPKSRVLEIGCGCGRTAVQLASFLEAEKYVGMDIEMVSLEACRDNPHLKRRGFKFDLIDIQNNEYNPKGRFRADEYRFSYLDGSMDCVFLISVFTHMLPEDVSNYVTEIGRMLDRGGMCLFSTFLIDHGRGGRGLNFAHDGNGFSYYDVRMPEIAVAYPQRFFEDSFGRAGLVLHEVKLGSWRDDGRGSYPEFGQDVLVFKKAA